MRFSINGRNESLETGRKCMILHGHQKRVLKEVIRYYVETTNKKYEDFILDVQKSANKTTEELEYSEWLAIQSYTLLKNYEITIQDCIENKDIIRATIKEEESRVNGEFYTPEVWCVQGREYLQDMLGDLWGKAYIWDASCGTGNLLKSIDYPMDKIFMSSLLEEDIEMVKSILPDVEAFQCDFVKDIDWDEFNRHFSGRLPERLQQVLKNNEPLVFYMNPPYKVMKADSTDVGSYMSSMGLTKCALDIFHQFVYRILMLKREYNLTNIYMGLFGPPTLLNSNMLKPLRDELMNEFTFHDGMSFVASDFSNTSDSVDWAIVYSAWRPKLETDTEKGILLSVKQADLDDKVETIGKRLITRAGNMEILHDWSKPKDIIRYENMPEITTYANFKGNLAKAPLNAIAYMMSSNAVNRGTRRCCIASLPTPDNVPITVENFWRCVSSYGARRSYGASKIAHNNSQFYTKPDTTLDGYQQWVIDNLALFLFDYDSQQGAYRDVEVGGARWTIANTLFPISKEEVSGIVTDENIKRDLELNEARNTWFLNIVNQYKDSFTQEAKDLYEHCISILKKSLEGEARKQYAYQNHLVSWDAGLIQLRLTEGMIASDDLEKYEYLLSKLKHKQIQGVYSFGFMENGVDEKFLATMRKGKS